MAYKTYFDPNKLDLFKNRLLELMLANGLDTAAKLAKELLNRDLVRVQPQKKEGKKVENIQISKEKSIEKKILKHLNEDTTDKVQGEFIRAYSELFNVSPEYLMGFTDIKSMDMETRTICEITGLSEGLVTLLKNNSPLYPYSKWFNKMFETQNTFYNFIDSLEEFDQADFEKVIPNPHDQTLHERFDEDTINKAYDLVEGPVAYEHDDLNLSEDEIEAIKLVNKAIDFAIDVQDDKEMRWKILRYDMGESARRLLDALFSE